MNLRVNNSFLWFFLFIQCIGKLQTLLISEKPPNAAIKLMKELELSYYAEEETSGNIFDLRNKFHDWNKELMKVNQSMFLESKLPTKTQKLLVTFSTVYDNINYYSDDIGLDIKENDDEVIKMFNDLVKYVSDTYKWYDFLISLNTVVSSYQVRKNVFSDSNEVFPFSKNCTVYKDSFSLSKSKLFEKLIYKIKYFNFDIDYRDNTEQKPEIMYDNVKDIKINGVKFEHFCRIIKSASNSVASTKCEGNTMYVRGEFVRMSEISNNKCENFQSVQVYALNTIYIDSDFKQPGKQLILIAPFIVVKPITMKCVPKYIPCYHLPNLDWLTSVITEKNKTFLNLKTQEDLEKLCSKKGRTIQPKCFTDFYKGAELPSLDLVTKHNYSEIPDRHGGILYGFDKDVNTNKSGYISINFGWMEENEMIAYDDSPFEIRRLISNQENSLYDLVDYNQSESNSSNHLKTITLTSQHIDYHTSFINYKNYFVQNLDEKNDHKKRFLWEFYRNLNFVTRAHQFFNTLNMAKELEILDELYLSNRQDIYFSSLYDDFAISINDEFHTHRCDDDCKKIMYYLLSSVASKFNAIEYSSNHIVKNMDQHIEDLKNNMNWTEDSLVSQRLLNFIDEKRKHIRSQIQENVLLTRNFIKPEIEDVINELHEHSKKLQIEVSRLSANELTSANSILSLWKNLLNEKLAFAAHCILLMSKPFEIESVFRRQEDGIILNNRRVLKNSSDYSDLTQALQKLSQTVVNITSNITKQEKSVLKIIIHKMKKDNLLSDLEKKFEQIMHANSSNAFELFEKNLMDYENSHRSSNFSAKDNETLLVHQILNDLRYAELSPDLYLDHRIDEKINHGSKHEIRLDLLHRYARRVDTILNRTLKSMQQMLDKENLSKDLMFDQIQLMVTLGNALSQLIPLFKQFNKSNKFKFSMLTFSEVMASYGNIQNLSEDLLSWEELSDFLKDKNFLLKEQTNDTTVDKVIDGLKEKTQFNILLAFYHNFLHSYKQHIFPFGFARSVNTLPEIGSMNLTEMKQSLVRHAETFPKSLPRDYANFEKYLQYKFFHRSKDGAVQPFFVWDNQTYGGDIAKLLEGETITLRASLMEGLNLNAVKFKTVQIKLNALGSDQDELQNTLSKFVVKLKHLGFSYYKCDDQCYMIKMQSVEYNFGFENDTVENPKTGSEQSGSDYFLSPYSLWQLELQSVESKNASFSELSQFKYKVDIDLEGHGMYLDYSGKDVCNNDLIKHYVRLFCFSW